MYLGIIFSMKRAEFESKNLSQRVFWAVKSGNVYEIDDLFHMIKHDDSEVLIELLSCFVKLDSPLAKAEVESLFGETNAIFQKEHMKERVYSASIKLAEIYSKTRITEAQRVSQDVLNIIENEFCDEKLSLFKVAHRLNISHSHLSTLIKKTLGRNFKEILTERRMTKAHEFVLTTDLKVLEIAKKCGYSDQYHFSFSFKKYFGLSPQGLRQKAHQNDDNI